ncbi:MAG: cyclase family protein [Terriglobales bacterium]
MKLTTFALSCALALAIFLFAQGRHTPVEQPAFNHVIDLTHALNSSVPAFDPGEKLAARTVSTFAKQGYFAREITLPEHFGTHFDAPAHMTANRWTVDQVPAERLVRPLIVIDVTDKVKNDPDYRVSVDDLANWEQAHGHVPPGALVVARTGWDSRWDSAQRYRNADARGVPHFPGWSLDAAKFLVEARNVVGLGIDTLSVDYGPSTNFPVHRYCTARDLYQVENLANLAMVPPIGALVVVAPIKLEGGSGAPARVLALVK